MILAFPTQKLTLIFLLGFLTSCFNTSLSGPSAPSPQLILPSGQIIELELAMTPQEQERGLSGRASESFPPDRGMLFIYQESDFRQFWMPDTYFDLAIIFLDENFRVIALENPVPHHPSRREPVPRTSTYWSRHVLEMRSDSPWVSELKVGAQLKVNYLEQHLQK